MRWSHFNFESNGTGQEEAYRFRGFPAAFSADVVRPHPVIPDQFYFLAGKALFLQARSSVPIPIAEQVETFGIAGSHLYFVTKNGFFVESGLDGHDTKLLGRKGLFLSEETPPRLVVSPSGAVLVLDSAGGLFLYRPGQDVELGLVGGNASGLDFSDRGDRMIFWNGGELWVYWLTDNPAQPFDLAGTKKKIFSGEALIHNAVLDRDGTHIIIAADAGIRMAEIDDRGGVNEHTLVGQPARSFSFEAKTATLYWVAESQLRSAALK